MYINIYIYLYMYIYTYIYIYQRRLSLLRLPVEFNMILPFFGVEIPT